MLKINHLLSEYLSDFIFNVIVIINCFKLYNFNFGYPAAAFNATKSNI